MPGLRSSQAGPSVAIPHVGYGGGSAGPHGGVYPTMSWHAQFVAGGTQGAGTDDPATFVVYNGDVLQLSLYGVHSDFIGDGNLMQFTGKATEVGGSGIVTGWIWNITGDGAQPGVGGGPGSGRAQGAGNTVGFPSGNVYGPGSPLVVSWAIGPGNDGYHAYMGTFYDHGTGGVAPQTMDIYAHVVVIQPGANRPKP